MPWLGQPTYSLFLRNSFPDIAHANKPNHAQKENMEGMQATKISIARFGLRINATKPGMNMKIIPATIANIIIMKFCVSKNVRNSSKVPFPRTACLKS